MIQAIEENISQSLGLDLEDSPLRCFLRSEASGFTSSKSRM